MEVAAGEMPTAGELGPVAELDRRRRRLLEWRSWQGEWDPGAPVAGRNEPLESSPLMSLKESKLERRREVQKLEG